MARTPIRDIRRRELQKAAYEAAMIYGFQNITLEDIASHAGISKGLIHHYFRNKQEFVHQAVRYGLSLYREAVLRDLKRARSPSERLWAIIYGNFTPEIFDSQTTKGWLEMFDASLDDEYLRRLYEILELRTVSNLTAALRPLVPPSKLKEIIRGIMRLIAGLWFLASSQSEVTSAVALDLISDYLRVAVPGFDVSVITDS